MGKDPRTRQVSLTFTSSSTPTFVIVQIYPPQAIDIQHEAYGVFAGPWGFNCICISRCASPSRCWTGM